MTDIIFTIPDRKGRKYIHGTDPTHPYEVVYVNNRGIVGVKDTDEIGGEETPRVRVVTWDVLTGRKDHEDFDELIKLGWGNKYGGRHSSILLNGEISTCECCGAPIDTEDGELARRIDQAVSFLTA